MGGHGPWPLSAPRSAPPALLYEKRPQRVATVDRLRPPHRLSGILKPPPSSRCTLSAQSSSKSQSIQTSARSVYAGQWAPTELAASSIRALLAANAPAEW